MRFAELNLLKYGRFDGCDLHFPAKTPDLHIIFGPNEAGKSTTMAAVSDLLFGFPHSTSYDFLHDKQLLRIGAVLQADGEPLVCRRKKGRVGTLMDADERAIDEGPLLALLAGHTEESFQRMFSLDHRRLHQGGEAILQAQDDVGQAIFAAGSGLIGITRFLDRLEEEAKGIWAKRVGNTTYHAAQKAFDDAKIRLKEAQVKPAAWDEMRLSLQRLDEKLAKLRTQRGDLDREREKIERHRRVLPPAALYRKAERDLAALGDVIELPPNAAELQREALATHAKAQTEAELADGQAKKHTKALEELIVNEALLDRSPEIDALREKKGAVDKALNDLPRRRTDLAAHGRLIAELQREIGWPAEPVSKAKARLPERVRLAEVRSLLEERNGLDALLDAAEKDRTARQQDIADLERERTSLPVARDMTALGDALRYVRGLGDLDAAVATAGREAEKRKQALHAALAQLTPSVGDAAALRALKLPGEREVADAMAELSSIEATLVESERDLRGTKDRRDGLELQRDQLMRDERAISADVVTSARLERNTTWGALRAHVVERVPLSDPAATASQFEQQSSAADDVSDQRFASAAQSGELAATERDIERINLAIMQQEKRVNDAQADVERVAARWRAALAPAGIDLAPKVYAAWTERLVRVLDAADAGNEADVTLETVTASRTKATDVLTSALKAAGSPAPATSGPFGLLLQSAEKAFEAEDAASKRRDALQTKAGTAAATLGRADAALTKSRAGIDDWNSRWAAAVLAAGLDPSATHAVVRIRLDLLEEARSEIDEILGLDHRTTTMQADIDDFDREVRAVAAACSMTDDDKSAADLLIALAHGAGEAKTLAERRKGFEVQLAASEKQRQAAQDAAALAKADLRPLIEAVGAKDDAGLIAAIDRSDRGRTLRADLDRLGNDIVKAGGGPLLEALLEDVRGADSDALTARSSQLQDELQGLQEEIEAVAAERATVQTEFARFDDGPDAAIAASDMEQARSEMASRAEAYVRKRAEVNLLRWAIDRYRAEKQTPLLKRASTLFSTLTRGNYVRLLVDVDGSKARLSGLSRSDAVVPVEGMSEGTVDQLFLALRLAAVEDVVDAGAKLPFLADDLFVNYDDERALAGFEVLAELAKSTQVLFFTHHRHLLDIAEKAIGKANTSICELA
jgi:uncharacterized protein YhaN